MSSTDSESETSVTKASSTPVLEWYSKLYSRRVDIVGDYAGNELFLIEGDSLLLECFSDKHIDFDPGFQLLHATYVVEHFLRGLVSRRCSFHIAFFDQHRELCVPLFVSTANREKYLLARAAIIRHLRANLASVLPEVEVHVFSSVRSDAFAEYLRSTDVYFIMAHDGASFSSMRKRQLLRKNLDAFKDEEQAAQGNELRVKTMFRLLIYWFIERGYNTALVNGLEWRDTKVVTTILERPHRTKRAMLSATPEMAQEDPKTDANGSGSAMLKKIQSAGQSGLSEREYLTVIIATKLGAKNEAFNKHSRAFLRHTALLSQLRLSERRLEVTDLPEDATTFLRELYSELQTLLESPHWGNDINKLKPTCDIADLFDGRVFAACVQDSSLGEGKRYEVLLNAVRTLHGADPSDLSDPEDSPSEKSRTTDTKLSRTTNTYTVLPFSNSVFEKHLGPIQLEVDRSGDIVDASSARIFQELTHWHNSKRPIDPKLREEQMAKSQKQQFFARRRNQWFMAEMQSYAASLTNAVGKVLEPEIITTGTKTKPTTRPANDKQDENVTPKPSSKAPKKGAGARKQAIMADIAANKNKKDEVTSDKLLSGWRTTCSGFEKDQSSMAKYQKAKQYLITLNNDLKREVLESEVRLYMLNVLLGLWMSHCRDNSKQDGLHVTALIFDIISSFAKLRTPITKTIATSIQSSISSLGLPQVPIPSPVGDRPLAFQFVLKNSSGLDLLIPLPSRQFQLLHCGPYFERSIDSAPDPRVPFEPDAWQRKVLDEIDAKRSLLVVAPTSAGKTFISFYAMKQVLESNDDDILVYVAPTKALVNQIAAEVQARFSKTYKYPGNSVWGIHTRDYRINNPTGCQILVTVPHILQIMLMAPVNANSWSRRVKWIIFDEVHSIGQAEDGLVWEQLLLLAPCPILALSATIGNPDEFSAWLTSTQRAVGNDLTMVSHPHRYSDLRKFIYTAPKSFNFRGLSEDRAFARLGLDGRKDFTFLHPVASLTNRTRGVPRDLSLESRDCFMLWETMAKYQNSTYKVDASLDPSNLPQVVKKADIIKWEAALKSVLHDWIADTESPYESVLEHLSRPVKELEDRLRKEEAKDQDAEDEEIEKPDDDEVDVHHSVESILPMLADLHEQDALPGIIFNYDRGLCERICRVLMSQLESSETAWKESSPKWKSTIQKWEEWKKAMTKAGKRGPPKLSKKKGGGGDEEGLTKEDLLRDTANNEASPWASFDPTLPQEGFHFADNKKLAREHLAKYEKDLIRREVPQYLLDAMRRGIGVHHAGMNRKYRQVVEMLFRKGYLRVVVATGTLALGINMPCKTVIFSGDSVFLTALNYRQAAGRAGRRGFDMLGNVVFHGISISKIHRLISSRLPDLNGHFPITTTLVLRLFTLLNESKNSPFAVSSVNALLSQPRLYLGGEESKMTVLHHLRFSIEYLRRQFLLDSRGAPLNFAGCVSHLYFTENSAFAFHALLKDGFFHQLCANVNTGPEPVLKELMLTMAHLFGRQYCRQADEEFVEEVVKRSPSIVFLPSMPKQAADVLRKHNESTLDIFTAYVQTFVDQHVQHADDTLPLTQVKVGGDSTADSSKLRRRSPTTVRSSFVALSGHGDAFESVHDLCKTSRSGVFLEEAVVPYVGLYPEESELPLNAYLYDFFMHGDIKALATANRIRSGDVWFVLNDFSMVLATIVTSLSNFMNLTSQSDLSDIRGEGDESEERKEDNLLPEDSGYETASTVSGQTKTGPVTQDLPIQVKKKKKVFDSWDDDDDDEEEVAAEIAAKEKQRDLEMQKLQDKPAWEEGTGLLNVLKAFQLLREDFDVKFRAMWA
ncbi:DEAD/DEAH box helicase-like protein [Massariosphaeria phaeospora]|uniref:DEAD/DEAH box helicase-like protein n=1 Tax=Massariosphaeria phaeospora TaxID=100035 RepID=A0A7C8IER5_9PLEO|nr:DEAD/DEAH box helicase-like protein [Massariosphaeria phaeospora]